MDGSFSLAVWDAPAGNTLVNALMTALRPRVPVGLTAPFDQMAAWAAEGKRTRLLQKVGLQEVRAKDFCWHYAFDDADAWWQFLIGGMFDRHFAQLDAAAAEQVRSEVADTLAVYQQEDGSYQIPHTCRLYSGVKAE